VLKAIREFEAKHLRRDIPDFGPGDTLRVSVRIKEGGKERTQVFEGVCISRRGGGMSETFTVRRVSYGVGMERIFPLHSPAIEKIDVVRRGKVRRAKLYYLRELRGKKARITEDRRATDRDREALRAKNSANHGSAGGSADSTASSKASE